MEKTIPYQLSGNELYTSQKGKTRRDGPAIVLDHVNDPRNVGGILRVAEAFGSRLVVLPRMGDFPDLKS